jgi:hypothetical protein
MSEVTGQYYKSEDGHLSPGAIAGIVVGVTLGIPLLIAVGWGFLICYRRHLAPVTARKPRPENHKQVAARIQADFGTGEEEVEEEGITQQENFQNGHPVEVELETTRKTPPSQESSVGMTAINIDDPEIVHAMPNGNSQV